MTAAKAAQAAAEVLIFEAADPDERLFVACGCGHRSAFHGSDGCKYVTAGKPPSTQYGSTTPGTPDVPCMCPTPREVVYLGGRVPVAQAEVTK